MKVWQLLTILRGGVSALALSLNGGPALDPRITFTRASVATSFDSTGTLVSNAVNAARFDYDPLTLASRGLLIEPERTNHNRNSLMVGASAGTPGTLPTNWIISGIGAGTLSRQIVETGTSNGIAYVDVRYFGTTSTTNLIIAPETTTQIVAADGETWTTSCYLALVGTLTNVTSVRVVNSVRTSVGGSLASIQGVNLIPSLTGTLVRHNIVSTINDPSTGRIQPGVLLGFVSGTVIDITLRLGTPQTELGSTLTSVIPTSTIAVTRSADVAKFTPPAGVTTVRYTFDDDTTADVSVTPGIEYTIPTNLARPNIKSIVSV